MVRMKVGHRVIPFVPVHIDHDPVKRADTRHAPTIAASAIEFSGKEQDQGSDSGLSSQFNGLCVTATMLPAAVITTIKTTPGWQLHQHQPGYHTWTTPSGRHYTTGPTTYPI